MSACIETNPPQDLSPFVECLWSSVPDCDYDCDVRPDGTLELCFVLSESNPDTLLFGPATRRSRFQMKGGLQYMGVRFRPGVGSSLLGDNASLLADRSVSLRSCEMFSAEHILDIKDFTERRYHVESALRVFCSGLGALSARCVPHAISMIEKQHGDVRIETVAEACNVSQRQLERLFSQEVGIRPKFYARLVRARNAADYIERHPGEGRANVAALYGFADQAHLIRELHSLGRDGSLSI